MLARFLRRNFSYVAAILVAASPLSSFAENETPALSPSDLVGTSKPLLPETMGTNFKTLTESFISQLNQIGKEPPAIFIPFPDETQSVIIHDNSFDPRSNLLLVIGETQDGLAAGEIRNDLNQTYLGSMRCDQLSLEENLDGFRIFSGAHETSHYIDKLHVGYRTLLGELSSILVSKMTGGDIGPHFIEDIKISPENYEFISTAQQRLTEGDDKRSVLRDLVTAARQESRTQDEIELVVALALLLPQTDERVADTSAALYMLSNYSDGDDVVRKMIDLRLANRDLDVVHDTVSSLEEARSIFHKSPKYRLSIIETIDWAADIIASKNVDPPRAYNDKLLKLRGSAPQTDDSNEGLNAYRRLCSISSESKGLKVSP